MATIDLFSNQTQNASSNAFKVNGGQINTANRKSYLEINGVLDNASIVLENKDPAGAWHSTGREDEIKLITNTPGVLPIDYSDELELRVVISGVGASTSLSIWVKNAKEVI